MGGCVPQPLCRSVMPSSSICLLVFDEPMRLGWQDSRVYTGCTDAFPSVFIDKPQASRCARWRLASEMPLFALRLNAVEALDPKGASGREWCYVEPQAELSAFLARCRPPMMLGGRPAWRRRLGILWCVADLERRIVRSTASLSLPAPGWLP